MASAARHLHRRGLVKNNSTPIYYTDLKMYNPITKTSTIRPEYKKRIATLEKAGNDDNEMMVTGVGLCNNNMGKELGHHYIRNNIQKADHISIATYDDTHTIIVAMAVLEIKQGTNDAYLSVLCANRHDYNTLGAGKRLLENYVIPLLKSWHLLGLALHAVPNKISYYHTLKFTLGHNCDSNRTAKLTKRATLHTIKEGKPILDKLETIDLAVVEPRYEQYFKDLDKLGLLEKYTDDCDENRFHSETIADLLEQDRQLESAYTTELSEYNIRKKAGQLDKQAKKPTKKDNIIRSNRYACLNNGFYMYLCFKEGHEVIEPENHVYEKYSATAAHEESTQRKGWRDKKEEVVGPTTHEEWTQRKGGWNKKAEVLGLTTHEESTPRKGGRDEKEEVLGPTASPTAPWADAPLAFNKDIQKEVVMPRNGDYDEFFFRPLTTSPKVDHNKSQPASPARPLILAPLRPEPPTQPSTTAKEKKKKKEPQHTVIPEATTYIADPLEFIGYAGDTPMETEWETNMVKWKMKPSTKNLSRSELLAMYVANLGDRQAAIVNGDSKTDIRWYDEILKYLNLAILEFDMAFENEKVLQDRLTLVNSLIEEYTNQGQLVEVRYLEDQERLVRTMIEKKKGKQMDKEITFRRPRGGGGPPPHTATPTKARAQAINKTVLPPPAEKYESDTASSYSTVFEDTDNTGTSEEEEEDYHEPRPHATPTSTNLSDQHIQNILAATDSRIQFRYRSKDDLRLALEGWRYRIKNATQTHLVAKYKIKVKAIKKLLPEDVVPNTYPTMHEEDDD